MDGVPLLGQNSCIWDIEFKICQVSKSIPAAKSQNIVISGIQKPTWAKFWEFDFFLSEKTRLYIVMGHQNLSSPLLSYKCLQNIQFLERKCYISWRSTSNRDSKYSVFRKKMLHFIEVYLTGKNSKFFKKIAKLGFPCYIYFQ